MGSSIPGSAVQSVPSRAFDRPEDTRLGQVYGARAAAGERSGFRLLVPGQEAFLARAALAEASERTLDLQYYIIAEDATATLLLHRALLAAQRGVRVRLLIDDINAVGRDFDLATLAAHPNVQVRVFNPFRWRGPLGISRLFEYLGDSARLDRRMHNKLWIADNAVAVIGGRNLGDAYFNVHAEEDFSDLDLIAAGPVVREISASFDEYWNSGPSVPVGQFIGTPPQTGDVERILAGMATQAERFRDTDYARALRESGFGKRVRAGDIPLLEARAAVLDTPVPGGSRDQDEPIAQAVSRLVQGARREVLLITPYFIPGETGLTTLCALARRGVRVAVLTNSLASTDVSVVHAGYARYRPRLLACGVELYEMRPKQASAAAGTRPGLSSGASLHAKAVVVDGATVLLGSMNLDPRSRRSNTEVGVRIESAALAGQVTGLFRDATAPEESFRVALATPGDAGSAIVWTGRDDGRPVHYDGEPLAGLWRRIVVVLSGALAPEELL